MKKNNFDSRCTVKLASLILVVLAMFTAVSAAPMSPKASETANEAFGEIQNTEQKKTLSGTLASDFSGEGTEQSPYLLETSNDLYKFAQNINSGIGNDAYYKLTADVDFGGAEWICAGNAENPFAGDFDGNGKTVKNMTIVGSDNVGFFGYIYNASVSNINFENVAVSLETHAGKWTYVGVAVGYASCYKDSCEISQIAVNVSALDVSGVIKYTCVGGVVGYAVSGTNGSMLVENCYSTCDISLENLGGYAYVGGIAAQLEAGSGGHTLMTNCYNVGSVNAYSKNSAYAGGLVGYLKSHGSGYSPDTASLLSTEKDYLIKNSFAVASVSSKSTNYFSNVGRLVGSCNANAACDSSAVYPAKTDVSGIVTVSPSSETVSGAEVSLANLKSRAYLEDTLMFDFDNIWMMSEEADNPYPVLMPIKREYNAATTLSLVDTVKDTELYSGDFAVTVEKLNVREGHSIYFDRGTYFVGEISGGGTVKAHVNANVVVTGENKPKGYVEIDIGEKASSENVRYAEVAGNQYKIIENANRYGVVSDKALVVEIVEKTSEDTHKTVDSDYYYVNGTEGAYETTLLTSYMNNGYTGTSVRLRNPVGIRFSANILNRAKLESTSFEIQEYGYIFALKSLLDTTGKQLNFELAAQGVKAAYVTGAAYDKAQGIDKIFDSTNDELCVFTGVLYGIPDDRYDEVIAAKTYTKVNVGGESFVIYGEQMEDSLYNCVKKVDLSSLDEAEREMALEIINKAEGTL